MARRRKMAKAIKSGIGKAVVTEAAVEGVGKSIPNLVDYTKGQLGNVRDVITGKKGVKQGVKDNIRNQAKVTKEIGKNIVKSIGFNHESWYLVEDDKALMVGANFSTNMSNYLDGLSNAGSAAQNVKYSIPNVMRLQLLDVHPKDNITARGTSQSSNLNTYATEIQRIYMSLKRSATTAASYTAGAVAQYLQNITEFTKLLVIARRIYGTVSAYSAYDSLMPSSLAWGLGYDLNSFRDNIANFGNQIMVWSQSLAQYPLPPNAQGQLNSLIQRKIWLYGNIFKDSNTVKASQYVFVPTDVYMYKGTSAQTITLHERLSPSDVGGGSLTTYAEFLSIMQSAYECLLSSDAFANVAADMLKIWGLNFSVKLDFNIGYTLSAIYDEEALTQIQNASVYSDFTFNVGVGNVSGIQFRTVSTITTPAWMGNAPELEFINNQILVNANKDDISTGDLLKYTRLKFATIPSTSGTTKTVLTHGTEVCTNAVAIFRSSQSTRTNNIEYDWVGVNGVGQNDVATNSLCWSSFDYCPLTIIVAMSDTTNASPTFYARIPLWDFNNTAIIDGSTLATLNQIATHGLYRSQDLVKPIVTQKL